MFVITIYLINIDFDNHTNDLTNEHNKNIGLRVKKPRTVFYLFD